MLGFFYRSRTNDWKMYAKNTLFAVFLALPWLACCQTAPTHGFAQFYLKTPSIMTQQTNFTALYHLIRRGQSWPDPQAKDLEEVKLKRILGSFAADFLSTKMPLDFASTVNTKAVTEEELIKTMPRSLKSISFYVPMKRKRRARSKTQSLFRLWLWGMSYCPVQYKWIDMGKYVWPRYMKVGYCPKKSCSFPKGMTCQPSRKDVLVKVLLWYCSRSLRCSWKVFSERITSSCSCRCSGWYACLSDSHIIDNLVKHKRGYASLPYFLQTDKNIP